NTAQNQAQAQARADAEAAAAEANRIAEQARVDAENERLRAQERERRIRADERPAGENLGVEFGVGARDNQFSSTSDFLVKRDISGSSLGTSGSAGLGF
ncbi:hypothetical protein OAE88_00720, partial [bacterium]|nr:hypothetical protein [bacterium]